jgi:hypothetical protein
MAKLFGLQDAGNEALTLDMRYVLKKGWGLQVYALPFVGAKLPP